MLMPWSASPIAESSRGLVAAWFAGKREGHRDVGIWASVHNGEAWAEPALVAHALGVIARARNMSQLARETGLSREGLYKALSREGNPSLDTIMKAARGLGYRLKLERMR